MMTIFNQRGSFALTCIAVVLLMSETTASGVIITPGGAGALGTVHYLNENIALGTHSGGNALPDIGGVYVSPAANASFGNPDGSNGNNGDTSEAGFSGIGVYTGGSPMTWRANFGSRAGTPNLGNQSYAIGQIRVYGRANGSTAESEALITVLEQGSPTASANNLFADFPGPPNPVAFNFTGNTLIGQKLQYVSSTPNGIGAYSFSEIQAQGISNLILNGDTLALEVNSSGNDYLNVQGTANLNGQLSVTTINGYNYTPGDIYDLLTATSIDISNLSFNTNIDANRAFVMQIVAGGQGQILQLEVIALPAPEPSSLVLLSLGAIALVRRNRRR